MIERQRALWGEGSQRCPGEPLKNLRFSMTANTQAHFKLQSKNFFDLAHGQSPRWQADPPFRGEAACHCVVQRRYLPVEIIPAKPNAVPGAA
jgi:hypothetical protein